MRMFAGILFVILCAAPAWAQSTGTVRGVVTLEDTGKPVHNVQVLLLDVVARLRLTTKENTNPGCSSGKYNVAARLDRVPDVVQGVEVRAGLTGLPTFRSGYVSFESRYRS